MHNLLRTILLLIAIMIALFSSSALSAEPGGQFYRLHDGITAYVVNAAGKDFTVSLDVRDLNLYANGPREVLFKVYDPDGLPVVREVIPDDGCVSTNLPDRIGGWDHEIQYYTNIYAKGALPMQRWSAWSDPNRLQTLVARTFERPIKGGKPGVYRIVLAGTPDHYVTLHTTPELPYGVCGHPDFLQGHGDQLKKAYLYIPPGTSKLMFAAAEPDVPQSRRFKLTAPDGKVLFDGMATGGYTCPSGEEWDAATAGFTQGQYAGKLLTLDVSDGPNDYLIKTTFIQTGPAAFKDYVGMGSSAIYCPDAATATAIHGGMQVVDDQEFWHPFQVRFYQWLKAHPLDGDDQQKALRKELQAIFDGFRLLETSDGRGTASWNNWSYGMGYYGCNIFRPGWLLMRRDDVPAEVKALIREGLIIAGDRLSFAAGMEKVNGNAFSQINVALWYAQRATGDAMLKDRFETFWQRWTTEGWGKGSGLSPSGDSQEHFAHDLHYGSYILDNWRANNNTWVKGGGILGDATDDPRFQQVIDRYWNLYSYLLCRDGAGKMARVVTVCPWSARTANPPSGGAMGHLPDNFQWKGEPGPDLTADVNDGHEWFAARRVGYYVLTFHGRLAPDWTSETFEGQLGFGGGMLCQVTVPGKGPVIASTLNDAYGKGMHPSKWVNYHLHSLVGERWDGLPVVSGISEHDDARLVGNTVNSSGEIRGTHLRVIRSYTFNPDSIDCSLQMAKSDYAKTVKLWGHEGLWSEMRLAYEMIPYMPKGLDNKTPTTLKTAEGDPVTTGDIVTQSVRIDRGGFGVEIHFADPTTVSLGQNNTLLIHLVDPAPKPTPPGRVALKYKIVPFGAENAVTPPVTTAPKPVVPGDVEKTTVLPAPAGKPAVEVFDIDGHKAYLVSPAHKVAGGAWVWFAPVQDNSGKPGAHLTWMIEQFLNAGISIAGMNTAQPYGAYGSPDDCALFTKLYDELVQHHGLSRQPCLLAQSRGGIQLYNWAVEHPSSVACIVGIYAACDTTGWISYAFKPMDHLGALVKEHVPLFNIHGDSDVIVPLEKHAAELQRRYRQLGGEATLVVVKGKGHEIAPEYFQSQQLVDFVIAHAKVDTASSTEKR